MKTRQVLNIDGQLTGIYFENIQTVEDLHKAKETLNRLILEISIGC